MNDEQRRIVAALLDTALGEHRAAVEEYATPTGHRTIPRRDWWEPYGKVIECIDCDHIEEAQLMLEEDK